MVKALPNTSFLPVPKSAPAGHTTAAAHLLWQVFPRYPCLEYKDNSGQSCPVRYTWTASFGPGLMFWQKWFYLTPQFVAYQLPGHLLHPHWYFTAYSSICQVLLGALIQRHNHMRANHTACACNQSFYTHDTSPLSFHFGPVPKLRYWSTLLNRCIRSTFCRSFLPPLWTFGRSFGIYNL